MNSEGSESSPRKQSCEQSAVVPPHGLSYYVLWGVPFLAVWVALYLALAPVAHWLAYDVCRLTEKTRLGTSVEFFLFEIPKVFMLLLLVVFGVGILRTFFTPERTRRILAGKRESVAILLAALLGIPTPFCSCSAVPLFIGFVTAGVPLGVTFAFLVASPMVNEVALVMLFGLFGWKVAAIYASTGLAIAIVAGLIIGRLKMERYVEGWVYAIKSGDAAQEERPSWASRVRAGLDAVKDIIGRVWPYLIVGIGVGAGIHGYVPENFLAGIMGKGAWWAVPVVVLIGIPLYSNAAGIIPIVQALMGKGAALGTVLAFMMAVIGISPPEAVILRKVLKPQLIAIFFGIVAVGILIVGYVFNLVL
jgi:uncharacterized membrane protein YraQ (UPF0718 family)